jgi:hypothetical protein
MVIAGFAEFPRRSAPDVSSGSMGNVLWRWIVLPLIIGTLLFFARCSLGLLWLSTSKPSESAEATRPIDPKHLDAAERFARAIIEKRHRDAYALASPHLRKRLNANQFSECFQGWVPVQAYKIRPGDQDVSTDILCPKELRPLIRENVVIDFDGRDGDGFCALVYFVEDADGNPQVAHFLLDD